MTKSLTFLFAALCVAVAVTGCSRVSTAQPPVRPTTEGPATPTAYPALDLSAPDRAVRSYLEYVSLANRMANSEAATPTETEEEGVRVDAYIQLNREQGQGLDQHLGNLVFSAVRTKGATSTVLTKEDWTYRYFSLSTVKWIGEEASASYVATYTVALQKDGRWLVDSVEATTAPGSVAK